MNRSASHRHDRNRGMAIVYVGLSVLAIFGIISLSVDVGRIRVARGQIQTAADAAAMGAALTIPNIDLVGGWNFSNIDQVAVNLGVANKVTIDNVSVQLLPANDIEYGTWDSTNKVFTRLAWGGTTGSPGDPRQHANAVRVTAHRTAARNDPLPLPLASAFAHSSKDLTTTATAWVHNGPTQFGVVGLTSVDSNGTGATIDSYDPSAGAYGGSNIGHNANTASNGNIDLGNGDVYGDCRPGPGCTLSQGPTSIVTGWTQPLEAPLVFASVVVPAGTPTLPSTSPVGPGTYQTTNFNGGYTFTGPVTLYVTGSINIKKNSPITTYLNLPANLNIKVKGTGSVDVQGGGSIYAHLYAPQSAVSFQGSSNKFFGSIVSGSLSFKGTADIHYDQSQSSSDGGYSIVIVQ